jgi:carnitine 3-dehydrogenase
MERSSPITRVAIVGTGVIGASWAAYFLARGLDVSATDPAPGAEGRLRADVAAHWPALERLGPAGGAAVERLAFTTDLEEAVAGVGFVQESGPEREELKQSLFRALDAAAGAGVVLASSSSGLLPTAIQASCERHPERVVVGHPFNPAHLVPLVEVVGGERTSEEAIERAIGFYAAVGKRPIHLRAELPGHLANRLQAALWREAYSLVDRGVASVRDVDTAIAHGPGCAGRCSGRSSCSTCPGARAAWRTRSSTWVRRWWTGGTPWRRPRGPPSSSRRRSRASTPSSPRSTRRRWWPSATRCSSTCSP